MKNIIRTILITGIFITWMTNVVGQTYKMKIDLLEQTPSKVNKINNPYPLIDSRGIVGGSFMPFTKGDEVFYRISPDQGKEIELKALKGFHYIKDEAIIMYGADFYDCVSNELALIVYDTDGNKKAEYSEKLLSPFAVTPGIKSSLFVSGKLPSEGDQINCVIRKLGSDLGKSWELKLQNGFVQYMKVSPDGNYLLAVFYEYDKNDILTMLIDAESGKVLGEIPNLNTILNAEFIGGDTLAIAGSTHFNLYRISKSNGMQLLRAVNIPINTVSMGFSISVNPDKNIIAVAHCSDRSETESQISIFDLGSGELINKIYLPGDRSIRFYRILNFTSEGRFEILTNDYTYTYEYTY